MRAALCVITTFSSLTKPSPASATTGASPVASSASVTSAAIAAVAAARAAAVAAASTSSAANLVGQPAVTPSVQPVQAAGIITASTVNGRKRRISNSANVTANGVNPSSYPRMENSSNLSQSMDSVNTASGEEEVGTN